MKPSLLIMNPEPKLRCLKGRRGSGPKKRSNGSQNSRGSPPRPPGPPGPCPGPPICGGVSPCEVVEMLTTDGSSLSASRAKSGNPPTNGCADDGAAGVGAAASGVGSSPQKLMASTRCPRLKPAVAQAPATNPKMTSNTVLRARTCALMLPPCEFRL